MVRSKLSIFLIALCWISGTQVANAATITYTDRATFEGTLGASVIDDYSSSGYNPNNDVNIPDVLTNAQMNAVLGETDYSTTGFANNNIIIRQDLDPQYCAGCNGSYLLGFTTTSVGNSSGVFGAGFEFANIIPANLYHAFVTFGDSSTADFALPLAADTDVLTAFFGITSDLLISTMHLGLANGGTTQGLYFVMDNLTVGAIIPEPSTLTLLATGLLIIGRATRRKI